MKELYLVLDPETHRSQEKAGRWAPGFGGYEVWYDHDDTTEVWKAIPGWEGFYEASDTGQIRSVPRWIFRGNRWGHKTLSWQKGAILKPNLNNRGYLRVSLLKNDLKKTGIHVAHLVALTFLGPRPEGLLVRHYNDDRLDNRVENLRYGTQADNMQDAIRNGSRGSRPLLDIDETEVLRLRLEGRSRSQLAQMFGIGERTVSRILAGTRLKASPLTNGGTHGQTQASRPA